MATKADLVTAIMVHIKEVAAGETVSAEDSSVVGRMVDGVVGGYSVDGFFIDTAKIPDFIFEELKEVVSAVAAPAFDRPESEVRLLTVLAKGADRLVRNRIGPQKGHEPIEANYF